MIEIEAGWTVTEAGGGWYLVDDCWHLRLYDADDVLQETWTIGGDGPWNDT